MGEKTLFLETPRGFPGRTALPASMGLGQRSIEVWRFFSLDMSPHKATSVAALKKIYMFAICWFISFVFIYIYLYFGYSPKRTHMFPWNLSKIIKAFEEKMTNLNKEITTRSKTLEEVCFKFSCFLGCLGGHHNKSHQQCVFVVLSKANQPILVQEKSSCDNRLSMYGNIGMSDRSDPKTSEMYLFKRHWRYILLDNVCVYYIIMYTGDMCARKSLVPFVRTNMHIRHIRIFIFRKKFR